MSQRGNLYETPFIRVCLAVVTLVLIYALTLAARNGLADLYSRPAKNFLQDKRDAGETLSESEWHAVHVNLRQALDLVPNDPVTLTELGRLHRIQLESETLDRSGIERHGNLAVDYYEQAAMFRPAWPWVWSSLALIRFELYQETSDDYHQALIRATRFGAWEGAVQRLVTELGLDTWASLTAAAKKAVLGTIDRALKRQPDGLFSIVESEQEWPMLCRAAAPIAALAPDVGNITSAGEFSRLRRHCEELGLN